ncbi:hypothetical protein [Cohnella boryungensis]|uniref:SGNH/GDSL hydrolase family protein n=1 Tax=Cohnella boryungensis TaxID=768479 RepID=A0ABV8S4T8_9BACL
MKKYRRWYFSAIILLVLCCTGVAVTNYLVDPYSLFGKSAIAGLKLPTQEYLSKARYLATGKPEVIFLGSSRTSRGLDPRHYRLITGESAYNSGLSGANIYVARRYLEYALSHDSSLRKVVLGIDFEGFSQFSEIKPVFSEERLKSAAWVRQDLLGNLLTEQALKDSIKVLRINLSGNPYASDILLADGSYSEEEVILRNQRLMEQGTNMFYEHLKNHLHNREVYARYQLSEQSLDDLRRFVALCSDNQVELTVMIHPSHALQWEGIRVAGLWDEFEAWKREVVEITDVWDFSGFNSITTSSPDRFDMYMDQSHYGKKIGNYVMDRIWNSDKASVQENFGVLLTRDNLEEQLIRIRNERDNWERKHPDIVSRIENL